MIHPVNWVSVLTVFVSVFIGPGALGAQCPRAIRQTVPAWGEGGLEPAFPSMASIHAAILRCPDIETLQVRTALLGCSGWPDSFNFPFDARGGERYASAPLVLSLDGYSPDDNEWSRCSDVFARPWDFGLSRAGECLRHRLLPEAQRNKTNLDLWLDAMDFSRIHTLQLNYTRGWYTLTDQVAQKLPAKLPSLTSLAVHNAIAERFILALPNNSLSHLSWRNSEEEGEKCHHNDTGVSSLQRVLQHHGPTLRSLEYWSDEADSYAPPALTMEDVHALVKLVPNLSTLTVDLAGDDNGTHNGQQWPWEKLKALAEGLPGLTDLTVHFPLASECHRQQLSGHWYSDLLCEGECVGPDKYAQSMLNTTSAAEMARLMWQHSAGHQLNRVTFKAGDWTPSWDGPLAAFGWLEGQRVWVTCTRDNAAAEAQPDLGGVVCEGGDTLAIRQWERDCHQRTQAMPPGEQERLLF